MNRLNDSFKNGYRDGMGQAEVNVKYCLEKFFKKNNLPLFNEVEKIISVACLVDEKYLNQ